MPDLISLPTEVITGVFDCIRTIHHLEDEHWTNSHEESYRTFAALARTCQLFHPMATDYWCARYEISYDRPTLGFLQYLKSHPNTWKHVRHISVDSTCCPNCSYAARPAAETVADLLEDPTLIQIDISTLKHVQLYDCELALLFAGTSNLETLRVSSFDEPNE